MEKGTMFGVGLIILWLFFMWYSFYDVGVIQPELREQAYDKMETIGLPIIKVSVNSPSIWIEVESFNDFSLLLQEKNSTKIYYDSSSYYMIFDEDYQIGYRISCNAVLKDIQKEDK